MSDDFGAVVEQELIIPLKTLCELFAEEGAYTELAWFSNVLNMLDKPEDEECTHGVHATSGQHGDRHAAPRHGVDCAQTGRDPGGC